MPCNLPSPISCSDQQPPAAWHLDCQLQELIADGQGDLVKQLLQAFLMEARIHLQSAATALSDLKMADVRFHIHSVKGSAGSVGAQTLYELARRVEAVAVTLDAKAAAAGLSQMSEKFESVHECIQDFLENWNAQL